MSPERIKIVNDSLVTEYYWNGRMIVYVDNRLTDETFSEACDRLKPSPRTQHNDK